jgi:protein-L-isoaspartate(D-aspartate) O-methyltransferase
VKEFVPAAYRSLAFFDTEIPLPGGENMLAPRSKRACCRKPT